MSCISILCAMLGFLSPANRGGLLTATLLVFVLMGRDEFTGTSAALDGLAIEAGAWLLLYADEGEQARDPWHALRQRR